MQLLPMNHHIQYLDETLMPRLGRVRKAFAYLITNEFKAKGIPITLDQFIVLKNLIANDGQPQNNLACLTERDKTSLTRFLSTMEKKGLVKRVADTTDARVNKIHITEKGKAAFEKSMPILREIALMSHAGITRSEINEAINILNKVHNNLIKHYEAQ